MTSAQRPFHLFKDAIAPGNGKVDWGRLVWLSNRERAGVETTVGYVEIAPHTSNPTHRHHTCSETLLVLEGSLDHLVGRDTVPLQPGDALVVPPGMVHGATNTGGTTARMVVVYDVGERDFETVESPPAIK
jgi:quercetin dioxygenase-like cupin family protein